MKRPIHGLGTQRELFKTKWRISDDVRLKDTRHSEHAPDENRYLYRSTRLRVSGRCLNRRFRS